MHEKINRSTVRNFPSQASMARRAELLFRAHFPQFETKLFEVKFNEYVIYTPEAGKVKYFFESDFCKSWVPITLIIRITDELPRSFVQQLDKIKEEHVHNGYEGLSLTIVDIEDLLSVNMPDLPFPLRSKNQNNPIPLIFSGPLTLSQERAVREFFQKHLADWPIEISWETFEPEQTGNRKSVHRIRAGAVERAILPFTKQDEDFWFSNQDNIFRGSQIDYLIPGLKDNGSSCYVDASSFDQIDLRQLLLLYDTIYISPAIVSSNSYKSNFWENQKISHTDFFDLVSAGRVKVILTQPEDRIDPNFLNSVYERDSAAIIGRRTLSSVIASGIVRTAEEYILLRSDLRHLVSPLVEQIASDTKLPFHIVNRGLLWPAFARSACFAPLLSGGAYGIANFGVGRLFGEELKAFSGHDLQLESIATTQGVHIAHVLNATYIPPINDLAGWNAVRNLTADRLNFYRSFNSRISAKWVKNEERKIRKANIIPQLPLFDFRRYTTIDEILDISGRTSLTRKGRALISRLVEMPDEARIAEIERLGKAANQIKAKRERQSLRIDNFDNALSVIDTVFNLGLFPFKSSYNLATLIMNTSRKYRRLDRIVDYIERDVKMKNMSDDLEFLNKVNRVAEIRGY